MPYTFIQDVPANEEIYGRSEHGSAKDHRRGSSSTSPSSTTAASAISGSSDLGGVG